MEKKQKKEELKGFAFDFRTVEIEDIDGKKEMIDISKELGRNMWMNALGEDELKFGKEIYTAGVVELNRPRAEMAKAAVDKYFRAFVKVSVIPKIEEIINKLK